MGKASNKKKAAKILRNLDRLHYPEDEANYPWLSALLNAYHIQETGIAVELEQEMKQRAKKLACGKGCDVCCLRPTVPLTEPEIRGVAWYATTQLTPDLREKVKNQVLNRHKSLTCPFLVEGACSVYPVRPIACRILHVFGEPCSPSGDIYLNRARDMWAHSRDLGRRVSYALMPLYGITGRLNMERAFDEGFLTNNSTSMMDQPWESLCGFER
jgi:Fe-S-cluster containining protein